VKSLASNWKQLVPKPKSRNLIVGSVGSGKSTLGCALLDGYHSDYPSHAVVIVDPKHRFVPVAPTNSALFPEGYGSRNHGRIEGVATSARLLSVVPRRGKLEGCVLIHDLGTALELFDYAFEHADVRKPVLFYNDESMDLHRNGMVDYRFKRIVQMGREKGLGHITINQRPKRIDVTLISESERIYIGTLHNINDRRALYETVAIADAKRLLEPMPAHVFWMVDQKDPANSRRFTLGAIDE